MVNKQINKRLNEMDLTTRIKTFSIENKWFSSMLQQMFSLLKKDPNIKFKYHKEEVLIHEEMKNMVCQLQINNYPFNPDLKQFFDYKSGFDYSDLCLLETKFCQEIRFFDSEDFNDIITFSTNVLMDLDNFFLLYIDKITKGRAFTKIIE